MSHLLQVLRMPTPKKGQVPLAIEMAVALETAPYLVSTSKAVTWIPEPPLKGPSRVKAVIRKAKWLPVFQEVLEAVYAKGVAEGWGNSFALTEIMDAVDYVKSYDLTELEILAHPKDVVSQKDALKEAGLVLRPSSWLVQGWAVVVPRERDFVGMLMRVGAEHLVVVVHNPARGMAIVRWDG